MEKLLEQIKNNWTDMEALQLSLLDIATEQFRLSELIAVEDTNLNQAFITEREETYKGTDSIAKARAKALVGNNKTIYEYQFEALTNLIGIVTSRISQLREARLEVAKYL